MRKPAAFVAAFLGTPILVLVPVRTADVQETEAQDIAEPDCGIGVLPGLQPVEYSSPLSR